MAIRKQIDLSSGYMAEYIRISAIKQDKTKISLTLDIYKDQAARNDGKPPVIANFIKKVMMTGNFLSRGNSAYSFDLTQSQFDNDNIYECAYEYLKTLPIFDGATDV